MRRLLVWPVLRCFPELFRRKTEKFAETAVQIVCTAKPRHTGRRLNGQSGMLQNLFGTLQTITAQQFRETAAQLLFQDMTGAGFTQPQRRSQITERTILTPEILIEPVADTVVPSA